MSTLKELRLRARLSVNELSHLARVDRGTVKRAEEGKPVQEVKAVAIVGALAETLADQLTLSDIEGLVIYR